MAVGNLGTTDSLDKVKSEAKRYLENAKENLKKANKEGDFYTDDKYVRTAAGIAYLGLLMMAQRIIDFNGLPKAKKNEDVKYYQENLAKINKKLLTYFNNGYEILHLLGYYRGATMVQIIGSGFQVYDYFLNELDKISPAKVEGFKQ
jgi:hypothetical protein